MQCISLIESEAADIHTQYEHGYYHTILRDLMQFGVPWLIGAWLFVRGNSKLYFIKLYYKYIGEMPYWSHLNVTDIINGGYERMFCWMRDHNSGNPYINDESFEELSFNMACKVDNPDLLTKHNIQYDRDEQWPAIKKYNPCVPVINKILDIEDITIYKLFIEMGSCYLFDNDNLFIRMMNLIRQDAQTMNYNEASLKNIYKWRFDSDFMDICRAGNLGALDTVNDGDSVDRYYCGIVESRYVVGVIRRLYECCSTEWDYSDLLERAYELRDRRMIELVLPRMDEIYWSRNGIEVLI
jgi:hypothetical protein